jgi:hypothetical protein
MLNTMKKLGLTDCQRKIETVAQGQRLSRAFIFATSVIVLCVENGCSDGERSIVKNHSSGGTAGTETAGTENGGKSSTAPDKGGAGGTAGETSSSTKGTESSIGTNTSQIDFAAPPARETRWALARAPEDVSDLYRPSTQYSLIRVGADEQVTVHAIPRIDTNVANVIRAGAFSEYGDQFAYVSDTDGVQKVVTLDLGVLPLEPKVLTTDLPTDVQKCSIDKWLTADLLKLTCLTIGTQIGVGVNIAISANAPSPNEILASPSLTSPDGRFTLLLRPSNGMRTEFDIVQRTPAGFVGPVLSTETFASHENYYSLSGPSFQWSSDSRRLAITWCDKHDYSYAVFDVTAEGKATKLLGSDIIRTSSVLNFAMSPGGNYVAIRNAPEPTTIRYLDGPQTAQVKLPAVIGDGTDFDSFWLNGEHFVHYTKDPTESYYLFASAKVTPDSLAQNSVDLVPWTDTLGVLRVYSYIKLTNSTLVIWRKIDSSMRLQLVTLKDNRANTINLLPGGLGDIESANRPIGLYDNTSFPTTDYGQTQTGLGVTGDPSNVLVVFDGDKPRLASSLSPVFESVGTQGFINDSTLVGSLVATPDLVGAIGFNSITQRHYWLFLDKNTAGPLVPIPLEYNGRKWFFAFPRRYIRD